MKVKSGRIFLIFSKYIRFCLVGGSGVIVDMGILFLLASPGMLGWNLTLSKVIAAEVAIVNNFFWNDIWTFRDTVSKECAKYSWLGRLLKFNLICLSGIAISVGLLNLQVYIFHIDMYIANFVSIVLVSLWNFIISMKLGWK